MHKKIIIGVLIAQLLILFPISLVSATEVKNNNLENEYIVIIEDDANLLTEQEKQKLKKEMVVLTEFGNVLFKTTNNINNYNSLKYIQDYYYSKLANRSGVAFYIDMNNRQVCACATGGLDKIITSSKCDTIMDNIYTYARKGNYYECASETFLQMNNLLNGKKIAESMKYICNAILSIMISLFAGYGIIMIISKNKKVPNKEIINECVISLEHSEIVATKTGTHSEYSPVSESSSSGGGSSSGRRWRILWKWRKPRILENNYYTKCFMTLERNEIIYENIS